MNPWEMSIWMLSISHVLGLDVMFKVFDNKRRALISVCVCVGVLDAEGSRRCRETQRAGERERGGGEREME